MSAALETSQGNTATLPLALAATAAFASASTSGRRASSATSAPLAAKRVAIARPSPLLAPVIMAVRPRRLMSMGTLLPSFERAKVAWMERSAIRDPAPRALRPGGRYAPCGYAAALDREAAALHKSPPDGRWVD